MDKPEKKLSATAIKISDIKDKIYEMDGVFYVLRPVQSTSDETEHCLVNEKIGGEVVFIQPESPHSSNESIIEVCDEIDSIKAKQSHKSPESYYESCEEAEPSSSSVNPDQNLTQDQNSLYEPQPSTSAVDTHLDITEDESCENPKLLPNHTNEATMINLFERQTRKRSLKKFKSDTVVYLGDNIAPTNNEWIIINSYFDAKYNSNESKALFWKRLLNSYHYDLKIFMDETEKYICDDCLKKEEKKLLVEIRHHRFSRRFKIRRRCTKCKRIYKTYGARGINCKECIVSYYAFVEEKLKCGGKLSYKCQFIN